MADKEGYKYLGILKGMIFVKRRRKKRFKKEYYKRVRAELKSKLNGGNVINTINI